MSPSLTDVLCTECGLCCDGSLFADVELSGREEASALEVLGLEIEDADQDHRGLLLQPCRALRGTRCGIYPHRPECCRTFECRLLQEARRGVVTVDWARRRIAEARQRIARIERLAGALGLRTGHLPLKERCAEALASSEDDGAESRARRLRNELETAMRSLERLISETFLTGSSAS